jgi:hypothetical protein
MAVCFVTVVFAASVWSAMALFRTGEQTDASNDAGMATGHSDHSGPATAWDPTAREIESFDEDLAPFEIRSYQLWDDDPTTNEE